MSAHEAIRQLTRAGVDFKTYYGFMQSFFRYISLLLLMAATLAAAAATRRALVIGLGSQLDPSWSKINGDRDVPIVVDMLRKSGFSDIRTLVNAQATKKGIEKAFEALISRAASGDIVYIHFSGHGQLVSDLNGDEPNGWDEAWIPYDAFRKYSRNYQGGNHLVDDEVGAFLTRLRKKIGRKGRIAVIVDACHSGGSTRDPATSKSPSTPESAALRGVLDEFRIPGKHPAYSPERRIREDWMTLSACRSNQQNQELRGYGRLTYLLVYGRLSFAGKTDKTIAEAIARLMKHRDYRGAYPQEPVLSGAYGRVLSGILKF